LLKLTAMLPREGKEGSVRPISQSSLLLVPIILDLIQSESPKEKIHAPCSKYPYSDFCFPDLSTGLRAIPSPGRVRRGLYAR